MSHSTDDPDRTLRRVQPQRGLARRNPRRTRRAASRRAAAGTLPCQEAPARAGQPSYLPRETSYVPVPWPVYPERRHHPVAAAIALAIVLTLAVNVVPRIASCSDSRPADQGTTAVTLPDGTTAEQPAPTGDAQPTVSDSVTSAAGSVADVARSVADVLGAAGKVSVQALGLLSDGLDQVAESAPQTRSAINGMMGRH